MLVIDLGVSRHLAFVLQNWSDPAPLRRNKNSLLVVKDPFPLSYKINT
jgi:hypothetical protein